MKLGKFSDMKPYEVRVCVLLSLLSMYTPFSGMLSLVVNYNPPHRCNYEDEILNTNNSFYEMVISYIKYSQDRLFRNITLLVNSEKNILIIKITN